MLLCVANHRDATMGDVNRLCWAYARFEKVTQDGQNVMLYGSLIFLAFFKIHTLQTCPSRHLEKQTSNISKWNELNFQRGCKTFNSHKPKENSVGSRNFWEKCHLENFCEQFQLIWDLIDRRDGFCFSTCFKITCYPLPYWSWLLQSCTFGKDLFSARLIFWCTWLYAPTCCSADERVTAGMPLSTTACS